MASGPRKAKRPVKKTKKVAIKDLKAKSASRVKGGVTYTPGVAEFKIESPSPISKKI